MDQPYIIVDFQFEAGFIYIALKNIGSHPAYAVTVKFKPKLMGLGGQKNVSDQHLFNNITFFPPQKEIRTLLDSSAAYFSRKAPLRVQATLTYQDRDNKKYRDLINHNLIIYKDIAFI